MIDSIIPINRDCIDHEVITKILSTSTKAFSVKFRYADGSVREFDGKEWKLTLPSYENCPIVNGAPDPYYRGHYEVEQGEAA